ncbi:MAG: aromatic ring-hydroxylating dioxygenase subunit alpha, partial [Acidobacteriota bacterium]
MTSPIEKIIDSYDPTRPLAEAWTIPASWYVDQRIERLERDTVFTRSWQCIGRSDQVGNPGDFVTAEFAGEPVMAVRGNDGVLRAFFNVCRHHAAAVETRAEGRAHLLRCPYHGWTYSLAGELKGTPDFQGVCDFDRASSGLVPVAAAEWEGFVFVRLSPEGPSLAEFVGPLVERFQSMNLSSLHFVERRHYAFDCNWKVFVDNYLDGGYHVP